MAWCRKSSVVWAVSSSGVTWAARVWGRLVFAAERRAHGPAVFDVREDRRENLKSRLAPLVPLGEQLGEFVLRLTCTSSHQGTTGQDYGDAVGRGYADAPSVRAAQAARRLGASQHERVERLPLVKVIGEESRSWFGLADLGQQSLGDLLRLVMQ